MFRYLCCFCLWSLVVGCSNRVDLSPVDMKLDDNGSGSIDSSYSSSDSNAGLDIVQMPINNETSVVSVNNVNIHTVSGHETLFDIANKYNIDPMNLASINSLRPPYHIKSGQKLRLPSVDNVYNNDKNLSIAQLPQDSFGKKSEIEKHNDSDKNIDEKSSNNNKKENDDLDNEVMGILSKPGVAGKNADQNSTENASQSIGHSFNEQAAELSKPKIIKSANDKPVDTDKKALKVEKKSKDDAANNVAWKSKGEAVVKSKDNAKSDVAEKSSKDNTKKAESKIDNGKMESPVNGGKVISKFGDTVDDMPNEGVNIKAPEGTKVQNVADGDVIYVGDKIEGHGNVVVVKHKNGLISTYAHLKDIKVRKGASVKAAQAIGSVGKTGDVTEPQLHFEVMKNKQPVDPMKYVSF